MKLAVVAAALFLALPAYATPYGPTAGLGLVSTPNMDRSEFSLRPMTGPVAQVGFEVGDWFDSQFMLQFTNVSGTVDFHNGVPLQGRDHAQTILGGYQLTFDIGGKQGLHGFTPFIGGGFLFGVAHVQVDASSPDAGVEQQLLASGVQQQDRDGPMLELHGVAGLRYHLSSGLGVRAELGYSTYGGFFGTWEPKLGVDYVF